jgi:mono/diheme cytochrome c family protein
MLKKHLLLTAICALAVPTAYAIQPVFNGNDGVLTNVFQTNCLACHSSTRTGAQRNGAPAGLNWDVYGTVVANFERIVARAVVENSMPPNFSALPKLNQQQKDALIAWQAAGFAETESAVSMIVPQYDGPFGVFEQVFATNCIACHSSTKTGAERHGAPAGLNWDVYANVAAFGNRIITRAVTLKTMPPASSGVPTLDLEQQNAMLAWKSAGFPAILPSSVSDTNFDFISQRLRLPVVTVGTNNYDAELVMMPMANSPTGFGFELFSAKLTTATSAKAATYTPNTGVVVIPEILLLNGTGKQPSNRVMAEMTLVPGTPQLRFAVTKLTFLSP